MQPYDDASLEAVLPHAAPAVVELAATNAAFTALALPAGMSPSVGRYRVILEPVAVAYELRFGAEATGFTVPANTLFEVPWALSRSALPSVKLSAGGPLTIRALVSWPDR